MEEFPRELLGAELDWKPTLCDALLDPVVETGSNKLVEGAALGAQLEAIGHNELKPERAANRVATIEAGLRIAKVRKDTAREDMLPPLRRHAVLAQRIDRLDPLTV